MSDLLETFVHTLRYEADDVIGVELRARGGGDLPPFDAGSHIDLHLPGGLIRSYSLTNPATERHRYVLGVLRDRASRGGSRAVHEQLRIGTPLHIAAPTNNFPLHVDAAHTVLIAGGIGVTPILCMARTLKALGKSFELIYLVRARSGAAFLGELQALGAPMHLHVDDECGGPADLKALLAKHAPSAQPHLYACGPTGMLNAFERIASELGHENAHVERFAAVEVAPAMDARASFTVELRRSGRSILVNPDKSVLDTLIAAGIKVDHSCCEGVCGTCETRVLEGEPDHRDSVLSAKERASKKVMMVCVSGCKSASLVLDL